MIIHRLGNAILSLTVLLVGSSLWAQAPSCFELFSLKVTKPIITQLNPNVFRVQNGTEDSAYKIYSGDSRSELKQEYNSLLMMTDILQQVQTDVLSVTENPRLSTKNEWLLKDIVWGKILQRRPLTYPVYGQLKQPPMLMMVTRFEKGREAMDFLEDPNIDIASKKAYIDSFWKDLDQVILWLKENPNYRYRGQKISVEVEYTGDYYEFPSKDGIFDYEYRTAHFRINNARMATHVAIDAISNLVIRPDSRVVLFDPF